MAKKVVIILAEGFEEIEAITPIDVLRRAGVDLIIAGVGSKTIKGAHGIVFQTDITLDELKNLPDAIILPGGLPGAANLQKSEKVKELVKKMDAQKKLIGAICAAPALVLAPAGVLNGRKATCYPGFEKNFSNKITFSLDRVIKDGHIITSRGPGSAMEFSLELVAQLVSPAKAEELRAGMLAKV